MIRFQDSVLCLVHLSREKENRLLSNVCSWTAFHFSVLFYSDVPVFHRAFETDTCCSGFPPSSPRNNFHLLLMTAKTERTCSSSNNADVVLCLCIRRISNRLTEAYSLPSSFIERYSPVSAPSMTTTPGLVAFMRSMPLKTHTHTHTTHNTRRLL